MADFWLKDCKIVPENRLISVGIEDGKIVSLKKIAPKKEETMDLKESVVLPGLIDAHVHFRDPGFTYKEDFRTGSMAAANGGFTTVMDMPNTKPPTNTPRAFSEKLKIARNKSLVDFGLHAGVNKLQDVKKIAALKPASFKIFMDLIDETFLAETFAELSKIEVNEGFEGLESHKPLISLHCEDKDIVMGETKKLKEKEYVNPEIYAHARPPEAEGVALSNAITLARKFNLAVHICHVSTKKSLELIEDAKKLGVKVTSEITPHHLFLDSSYLEKCGNFAKTNPPLRDIENKIDVGDLPDVDIVATDHAPHTIAEKEKDVWNAPPGIPNLETALPLLLTEINRRNMTFEDLKRLMCENPAKIFSLHNKGFIKERMDADFVVLDMKKEGVVNPDKFKSKAKYSPFKGFKVKGVPIMTMVGGNLVMEYGDLFKNQGKFVYD